MFYIDNFPASMEITALFRPHVRYRRGLIKSFDMPGNEFYADPPANIAFFLGKEPNLDWQGSPTASSRWSACRGKAGHLHGQLRRQRAAHAQPRLYGSVSEKKLLLLLQKHGLALTEYEGPASFATYLLTRSLGHGVEMLSIAAEIPGYLQGLNPLSIAAVYAPAVGDPQPAAGPGDAAGGEHEVGIGGERRGRQGRGTAADRVLEEEYDNELIESGEEE